MGRTEGERQPVGPAGLRAGAGRPPGGLRAQLPGELGEHLNAEVLRGECVSLENGTSLGWGWLGGGGDPSGAGESKFQEMEFVFGFLFLLSWASLLSRQ